MIQYAGILSINPHHREEDLPLRLSLVAKGWDTFLHIVQAGTHLLLHTRCPRAELAAIYTSQWVGIGKERAGDDTLLLGSHPYRTRLAQAGHQDDFTQSQQEEV